MVEVDKRVVKVWVSLGEKAEKEKCHRRFWLQQNVMKATKNDAKIAAKFGVVFGF